LKRLANLQPSKRDFEAARQLLDEMQCGPLADKQFGVLSQGERQQTLVARARMVNPLLVVLDEPCAGMDPGVRERFLWWLDSFAASASTCALALVTHHVEEIMPRFERTLAMREGRVVASGRTDAVLTHELLQNLYGVRISRVEQSAGRLWPIWQAIDS
jgi:iron complex transport system ATP-binding protein